MTLDITKPCTTRDGSVMLPWCEHCNGAGWLADYTPGVERAERCPVCKARAAAMRVTVGEGLEDKT